MFHSSGEFKGFYWSKAFHNLVSQSALREKLTDSTPADPATFDADDLKSTPSNVHST